MSWVGLLVVLVILFALFGWWYPSTGTPDNPRSPYVAWGPLPLLLIIFLVLFLTGVIH
jgi:hypothetical protein